MYIFCLLQIIKCGFYTRIAGHIQTDIDSKTQNTVPVVNINVGEYSIENYNRHSYSHWHFRNQTRMTLRMTIQWNIKKFNKIHRYRLYFNVHGRYKQFPRWPLYAHTHLKYILYTDEPYRNQIHQKYAEIRADSPSCDSVALT